MRRTLVTTGLFFVFALVSSAGIATAQDAALVKKGQEIYTAQKCSVCHAIAGKGGKANPLDGVGAKLSAEDIRQWIVSPAEATAKAKSIYEANKDTIGADPGKLKLGTVLKLPEPPTVQQAAR